MEMYAVRHALELLGEKNLLEFYQDKGLHKISAYHQFILSLARCIAGKMRILVLLNPQMNFSVTDMDSFYHCVAILQDLRINIIIITVRPDLYESVATRYAFLENMDLDDAFSVLEGSIL